MAFNFSIGDLFDAGKAVAGIVGMFDKQEMPKDVRQAASFNRDISNALMNPNDPMFTNLVDQETGQINRDFAEGLRQLMISDRRGRARGVGMFNPERRDEAIAQASARGRADAGDQARKAARTYLMNAANANNAAFNLAQPAMNLDAANRQNLYGGLEAAFDFGKTLLNGDPRQTSSLGGGTTVNVNGQPTRPTNVPAIYRTKSAGY